MPCRGPDSEDQLTRGELKEMGRAEKQAEVDKLTRMLCSLCAYVDKWHTIPVACLNDVDEIKMELIDWWEEHQKLDEKRMKELKARVLSRLTKEEKRALGL